MTKKLHKLFTSYFVPGAHNNHKPHVIRVPTLVLLLGIMCVGEAAFLLYTTAAFQPSMTGSFLADVSSAFSPAVLQALPEALIEQTNSFRAQNTLSALTPNTLLEKAAAAKAADMAAKGYFSHVDENGNLPWVWMQQAGYQYEYAGENLAVNFLDASAITQAWINSPAHRANLLDSHFTQIGIGAAEGDYQGHESIFVVQFFGSPLSQQQTPYPELAAASLHSRSATSAVVTAPSVATTTLAAAPASSTIVVAQVIPQAIPQTIPPDHNNPTSVASAVAAVTVSPEGFFKPALIAIVVFEFLIFAFSGFLIFVKHESPNMKIRISNLVARTRTEVALGMVLVVFAGSLVYVNSRVLAGSGSLPVSSVGSSTTIDGSR